MPGRLRTASRPLRTSICSLPYSLGFVAAIKSFVEFLAEKIAYDGRRDLLGIEPRLQQHIRTDDVAFAPGHALPPGALQLHQRVPPPREQFRADSFVFVT